MVQGARVAVYGSAVRAVAERWLPELGGDGSQDFVCSPAGLWLALGAVAAGARKETAGELRALLGVAEADAAEAVTAAARALAGTDALAVATGVWSLVPVYRAYREALPGIGFGAIDPDAIDAWVRERTGGLIERLPVPLQPDTVLALVNVLALKARWAQPFEPHRTRDADFTDACGVRHRVPTMHRNAWPGEAWRVCGATVVEVRCDHQGARVRFVLGEAGAAPADVLPAAWAPGGVRSPVDAEDVAVALPRFSVRTTIDITPQLPALGVHRATTGQADFSGLSPERLAISTVAQEAVVKVAELGVEAAAATVVLMQPGSAPRPRRIERIAFDRPFGFAVLDGTGEVPLFAGWQAQAPR
ncbi:serine protease [Streptomyces sp. A3M-1-3]|uniref:serpin family protein n=1 Tax=Streptomyces sp. A3M-1-3 TaxID=2962044 RepID=UPI0020B70061|nr:serpin family protein [Streptomyces sp. A3M-1-3]MCP3816632.1 serine protease [Streptomyces sp. A3M-1-3]